MGTDQTSTAQGQLAARLLARMRQARYPDSLLGPGGLDALLQPVADSLRPVVAGWRSDGPAGVGASKLGGRPDLPVELAWPLDAEGRAPLAFLCQLDLSEVAPHCDGRLPADGMWYLFSVCDSDTAYGGGIEPSTTAVCHVPADAGPLAPRDFPAALPGKARLAEQRLCFGRSLVCESCDPQTGRCEQERFDWAVEDAMAAALRELGAGEPQLRLLGHPWFFQDDMEELFDAGRELELLGFAGELVSGEFGEGEFHVVIERERLQAGALDAARVLFEPGT